MNLNKLIWITLENGFGGYSKCSETGLSSWAGTSRPSRPPRESTKVHQELAESKGK